MSRDKLTITIFNATGISKYAVDSILTFTQHTSLLFLIETWLLPPNQLLTNWQQHHTYGEPRSDTYSWIGKMGISLLVHPDFNLPVHGIEDSDPHFSKYHLTCTVANTLIHCLYLPHLSQLPMLSPSSPVYHSVTPTLQTHIFCGDFNARVGSFVGDHFTDPRGTQFYQWIAANGLTLWNKELACGQPILYRRNGSSIIDWFLSTNPLPNPQLTIRDDLSLDSDHKMLHLSFTLPRTDCLNSVPAPGRRLWRLHRLRDENIRDLYVAEFTRLVDPLAQQLDQFITTVPRQPPPIYDLTARVYEGLYTALDNSVQPVHHRSSRPGKWFWTDELQAAVDHSEKCYRKWRNAIGTAKLEWWLRL